MVSTLAQSLYKYEPKYVLNHRYMYDSEFQKEILKQIIDQFTLENMILVLSSQSLEKETTQEEEYFGVKYSVGDLPK